MGEKKRKRKSTRKSKKKMPQEKEEIRNTEKVQDEAVAMQVEEGENIPAENSAEELLKKASPEEQSEHETAPFAGEETPMEEDTSEDVHYRSYPLSRRLGIR